jgi:diguanylate cyclase (GGDEF)-like protein
VSTLLAPLATPLAVNDWRLLLARLWQQREQRRNQVQQALFEATAWPAQQPGQWPASEVAALEAAILTLRAYLAWRLGQTAEALAQIEPALKTCRALGEGHWLARALNVRACISFELGEVAVSLGLLEEMLPLARSHGDLELEACGLHDIGNIHLEHDSRLAAPFLQAALERFRQVGSSEGEGFSCFTLARLAFLQGDLPVAAGWLAKTLAIAQAAGLPYLETLVLAEQGRLAAQWQQPQQAEQLLRQALARNAEAGERPLWEAIEPLARLLLTQQRLVEAQTLLEGHLVAIDSIESRLFQMQTHQILAEVLEKRQDFAAAFYHLRQYTTLAEVLRQENSERIVRSLEVLHYTRLNEQIAEQERQKNTALQVAHDELHLVYEQLLLANARLEQLSRADGLTGVANRRAFDEKLRQSWQNHIERAQPLALILLDVDYFKRYNDHFGHHRGDECLKQVAEALAAAVAPPQLLARYGGEEFAVILEGQQRQSAAAYGESLRQCIANLALPHPDGLAQRVSISVGVASMVPQPGQDPKVLIEAADGQLYRAKQAGRDRVMVYKQRPVLATKPISDVGPAR